MKRTSTLTGFIVYNPDIGEAITHNNYYMGPDQDSWNIYPSERAAKAGRTSCIKAHLAEQEDMEKIKNLEIREIVKEMVYIF